MTVRPVIAILAWILCSLAAGCGPSTKGKAAAERAAAEKQAAEEKAAAEQKAAVEKAAAEQKALEEKAAAVKKAAQEKAAAAKRAEEEKVAAAKKAAEERAAAEKLLGGWLIGGSNRDDYTMGIDRTVRQSGKASGFIKAKVTDPKGHGALMQTFRADDYRGKRLRLSAFVKAEKVKDHGLWLQIDSETKTLRHAYGGKIQGTSDWKKHEIVVDVPEESLNITFGFSLGGRGQVWADDFLLEVVGNDVRVTSEPFDGDPFPEKLKPAQQKAPVNLDFEK
jgi:hypothetical protein